MSTLKMNRLRKYGTMSSLVANRIKETKTKVMIDVEGGLDENDVAIAKSNVNELKPDIRPVKLVLVKVRLIDKWDSACLHVCSSSNDFF